MLSSTLVHDTSIAAANMLTEMVFPNLLGVDIRISWLSVSHPLRSRIFWWARANAPGGSILKKTRALARMKLSWKTRWWYERLHPSVSSTFSACRQSAMRVKPSFDWARTASVTVRCRLSMNVLKQSPCALASRERISSACLSFSVSSRVSAAYSS
jgi:hypothetical protein